MRISYIYIHTVYFDHIYSMSPLNSLGLLPQHSLPPTSCPLHHIYFLLITHWVQYVWDHPLGHGQPTSSHMPKWLFPRCQQLPIALQLEVGSVTPSVRSGMLTGLILWWSCAHNLSCCEFISAIAMSRRQHFIAFFSILWLLYSFFPSLLWCSLRLVGKSWYKCHVYGCAFEVPYSQHFDWLEGSALTMVCFTKMLLWPKLKAELVYGVSLWHCCAEFKGEVFSFFSKIFPSYFLFVNGRHFKKIHLHF